MRRLRRGVYIKDEPAEDDVVETPPPQRPRLVLNKRPARAGLQQHAPRAKHAGFAHVGEDILCAIFAYLNQSQIKLCAGICRSWRAGAAMLTVASTPFETMLYLRDREGAEDCLIPGFIEEKHPDLNGAMRSIVVPLWLLYIYAHYMVLTVLGIQTYVLLGAGRLDDRGDGPLQDGAADSASGGETSR